VGGIILSALVVYLGVSLYEPPSCADGKKNQDERGVDCGGVCELACPFEIAKLSVEWVRLFEVSDGIWTALAYVEHANDDLYTRDAPYRFTLYDEAGEVLMETKIDTLGRVPSMVEFEWIQTPKWYQYKSPLLATVEGRGMQQPVFGTEVAAVVQNQYPVPLEGVEVAIIVYDVNQNAIAASETYVDYVEPRGSKRISFSWPTNLGDAPARFEFVPRVPRQE
jgi:hypothetical protein